MNDLLDWKVRPVTEDDLHRKRTTGDIDIFVADTITDEDGTDIGMFEHSCEVYYSMRVCYHCPPHDLQAIEYYGDTQFYIRY